MSFERLTIQDDRFLINRLIGQAPRYTLVREFFMNAQESATLAPEGQRFVRIYPTLIEGVRKLTFWNTGPGMDAVELRTATNISASINKQMSLSGNFGIGAKVSGLTVSPAGIRYRSCKNGVVHEVTIGFDQEADTFVRFVYEVEGRQESVFDVTQAVRKTADLSFDWTEVVLIGEDDDHDTVSEPIGKGIRVDRSYVATQIFRRFAEFRPGVRVILDVSVTKGGGRDETGRTRTLKTLQDVVSQLPNAEIVACPETGVKIQYLHDPKHANYSHSISALNNPATSSTSFCALVHRGERYDFRTGKKWSAVAPNYGIPFGSTVLTVEIYLPDDSALPNQYRDALTTVAERNPITTDDYAVKVRELMPEWVKDVIREAHPPRDENLDDLQKDLQKLLDEFRLPTSTYIKSLKAPERTENSDFGLDEARSAEVDPIDVDEDRFLRGERTFGQRATEKKVRKAPEGAKLSKEAQALERAPTIEILDDPAEIDEKQMKGRAARFYKDAQTLFINGLYSAVDRMIAELEIHFVGQAEGEALRCIVLRAAQRSMAFRVGKATCYAISKRLVDGWSLEDLDRATSPESLSLAADDYRQSLTTARKWISAELKAHGFAVAEPEVA
ncbi:hypothetical protein [Mesorhizobium sp.]|uniref:hypothetical protein n=1 Tax=Mesorhizobium sp. TaxID=1871066 RepID=UPI000FE8D43A|nr:hypothetical protein [Mesorhizobium sp.]RWH30678.1 MAG: hypothetical protein EOQ76_11750 [Mesorhizobium sp.]RWH35798.1 MAG: hypothetical protein EOQ79_20300 [Mesorhizobium sp.]TIM70975.1 MAG: hypothetical protein E5Y52_00540 [Mesorhizobium sp.]TIQ99688.1 MAG: hypothetical protein E5X36_10005 [Mesorhizobium sp.]TIR56647.1 MAG: hypothetical protein E5X22_27300 [Mesorhizobium sp.]